MNPYVKNRKLNILFIAMSLLLVLLTACSPSAQVAPTSTTAPTDTPTEAATEAVTEEVIEAVTEEAMEAATEEATEVVTEAAAEPTEEETVEVALAATEMETEEATEAATEAATEEATEAATEEVSPTPLPTEEATEEATAEATSEATTEAAAESEIAWECPESARGGQLNILNWSGYIGETTVADFERLCDVTTTFDIFDSNESLMARMRQGNAGYDVAFPNDFAVSIMAREGLIQPIDISQIPNFANIAEKWVGLPFDPDNEYSVPYLWGTFGILYDRNKTGKDILTWDDFFAYEGQVAWVDDTHSLLGTALQQLGYDPNTTDEAQVMEARDYLIANSGSVQTITSDPGPLFAGGEFDMITTYSGDAYQIIADCACDNFVYVVPSEGSVGDITNMVLLTDAPNPEVAIAFMDYILDPVVNAMIVNDAIYATANQAAMESGNIDPEILNNKAIWPDDAALSSLWFTEDLGDAEFYYSDAWDEVLVGVGGG